MPPYQRRHGEACLIAVFRIDGIKTEKSRAAPMTLIIETLERFLKIYFLKRLKNPIPT